MFGNCSDNRQTIINNSKRIDKANINKNLRFDKVYSSITMECVYAGNTYNVIYMHLYPDFQQLNYMASLIGTTINIGTFLGYTGNTGYSSGTHLHFEVGKHIFSQNGTLSYAVLQEGKKNTKSKNISQEIVNTGDTFGGNVSGKYSMATYIQAAKKFYDNGGLKGLKPTGARAGHTYKEVGNHSSGVDYAIAHYGTYIKKYCAMYGVVPSYTAAKMAMESNGGTVTGWTKSGSACGPMMIENIHLNKYVSAKNVQTGNTDKILVTNSNILNIETNIRIGIMIYASKLQGAKGNPVIAAQMYNYGNQTWLIGGHAAGIDSQGYCKRTNKNVTNVYNDNNDVGWLYDIMLYNNKVQANYKGNPFYAYEFMLSAQYAEKKI